MTTHATVDHQVALANEITAILRERIGYHEQFAAPIAEAIVSGLASRRGGDVLYVPTGNRKPRQLSERNAAILARTPLARWGKPADIAGGVLYLSSPLASFVTGTVLTIDGGYMAV